MTAALSDARDAAVRSAYAALNRGAVESFCALLLDPDVICIGAGGSSVVGPDSVAAEHVVLAVGFPDLCWRVQEVVCAGDQTFARLSLRGTHTGVWLGHQPTGRVVHLHACEAAEWQELRVVTRQLYWDRHELVEQITTG